MADVIDVLGESLTPTAVRSLGRAIGIDEQQAARLVAAVVPVFVERLRDNAAGGDGGRIAAALTDDHDGSILDAASLFLGGGFRSGPGAKIIGHVFGDEIDTVVAKVASSTGLSESVVTLGFSALAPLAMGAITKAAIGAVTAVVVVKLLDVAVDSIRSGRLQRALGAVNRQLDRDRDGNALDDVGRGAFGAVKTGAASVLNSGRKVAGNEKVRASASKTVAIGQRTLVTGARAAKKRLGGLFKRFGR